MKKHAPNELINQSDNVLLLSNPLVLMMRKLLLLLVVVLYGTNLSAQDSRNATTTGLMETKAFIASLRSNEQTSRSSTASFSVAQSVEELVYNVQPAQYLNSGVVKTYGEKPRHLITDKQSLSGLNNPALLKNNVDIVSIRINSASDLNGTIDLSLFSSFTSLKYIRIVSAVPTTAAAINQMIVNPEERLTVFYSIESGE